MAELPSQLVGLTAGDLTTTHGNVAEVLERGPRDASERSLLSALFALSLRTDGPEGYDQWAADVLWLATHTPCDALEWLDGSFGERAPAVWRRLTAAVEQPEPSGFGKPEVLVLAAALASTTSSGAREVADDWAAQTRDPLVRALLARGSAEQPETSLQGELMPRPFGPIATALLAMTLVLFVWRAVRVVGRLAFAYRKPARLRLGPSGLELSYRTELLGKTVRDRSLLVPVGNLARVTREVRFARAGMYLGLLALLVGTYLGMGLLVDGLRVPGGSPPLLGLALLFIALGLLIDFGLSTLTDGMRGRCRVVVVPLKGRTLCIGGLEPSRADAMLSALASSAAAAGDAKTA